jgi:hypothetical protein
MENFTHENNKKTESEMEAEAEPIQEETECQFSPKPVDSQFLQEDKHEKIPVWELLYGVIFRPTATFHLFRYYQPWGWAMGFLFIVNLVTILLTFLSLNSNDIPSKLVGVLQPLGASLGVYASIFFYPLTIMLFTIQVSILHFLAELMGGSGKILGLFSAFAFIQILGLFSAVANVFTSLFVSLGILFFLPLGLAMGIWQVILSVLAIREIYLLSTARSLLVLFLPIIIVIAVLVYMIFTGIAFIGPLLGTFRTYL